MKRDARLGNRGNGTAFFGFRKKRKARSVQANAASICRELGSIVYVGPSVDGSDKEYVKVLSGEVDRRKPSFA